MPTPSVIFTTYNATDWLEKTLWGFSAQTYPNVEIIVADDGSKDETRQLVDRVRDETGMNVKHVWQEDDGFQKSMIMNKAIVAASGDYLIFTDGDCIPRDDFVQVHVDNAEQGYFLSGGYLKLPMDTSKAITKDDILTGRCFDRDWLYANGLEKTYKTAKLTARGWKQKLFNALTPAGATWNGHNASGWKSNIFAANGFDMRMQYGGQDRELGERLFNAGLKSKQIRYSAVCVHLDHARGYATQESKDKNRAIRDYTIKNKVKQTEHGISALGA